MTKEVAKATLYNVLRALPGLDLTWIKEKLSTFAGRLSPSIQERLNKLLDNRLISHLNAVWKFQSMEICPNPEGEFYFVNAGFADKRIGIPVDIYVNDSYVTGIRTAQNNDGHTSINVGEEIIAGIIAVGKVILDLTALLALILALINAITAIKLNTSKTNPDESIDLLLDKTSMSLTAGQIGFIQFKSANGLVNVSGNTKPLVATCTMKDDGSGKVIAASAGQTTISLTDESSITKTLAVTVTAVGETPEEPIDDNTTTTETSIDWKKIGLFGLAGFSIWYLFFRKRD